MTFPATRLRRLRETEGLRRLVRETALAPDDFIHPLFVREGRGVREPVPSMPGVARLSIDELLAEAAGAVGDGIGAVILFGVPAHKDPQASGAYAEDGIVQRAVRALKAEFPGLVVVTDVCLCAYNDTGHCGLLTPEGRIDNDATLRVLEGVAVSHAAAGADVVAPSDMMDGRVGAIRWALDEAGHPGVAIMAYSAKYASAFYGPFRDAAGSAPRQGDRRSHQMDPANAREALREVALDVEEGADVIMVKPALAYLDVIRRVREAVAVPVAAYNVSGEYAMVKAAAERGWADERRVALEILTAIKRAGADLILTYHARDAARWLREG